jgi:hypothetical protein
MDFQYHVQFCNAHACGVYIYQSAQPFSSASDVLNILLFNSCIKLQDSPLPGITTGKCKFVVRSHFAVRFITGRTVNRTFAVRPVQSARQTLGAR